MTSKLPIELLEPSGTAGQVLTSNGAGSSASMQDPAAAATTNYFLLDIGDETTDITTGTAKKTLRIPLNLEVSTLRASVNTDPTGSSIIVDVNANGTTMMDTDKLEIDVSTSTTTAAATAPVITNAKIFDDQELTVDIDQIGSTIAGKGLKLAVIGTEFTPTGLLDEILASTCADIDATLSDSYGGSGQTWANLVLTPADAEIQTAYDMWLGDDGSATSTDPTFTGSAGDSAAYFLFDGGDNFVLKSNPTLVDEKHSDNGQDWWHCTCFRWSGVATNLILWSTGGHNASTEGIEYSIGSSGNGASIRTRYITTRNGTRTVVNLTANGYFVDGTDYCVITTYDSGSDVVTQYRNIVSETSTDVNTNTGTSSAGVQYALGRRSNGGNHLANGTRVYHQSWGNSLLTSGEAANIKSRLEARHGRTYNGA